AGALTLALILLAAAMVLAAWRIIRGPRAQDRVLGMDTLYLNGMLLALVFGLRTGSDLAFEAALIIGMLGFAATVAMAKFLMQVDVVECPRPPTPSGSPFRGRCWRWPAQRCRCWAPGAWCGWARSTCGSTPRRWAPPWAWPWCCWLAG